MNFYMKTLTGSLQSMCDSFTSRDDNFHEIMNVEDIISQLKQEKNNWEQKYLTLEATNKEKEEKLILD